MISVGFDPYCGPAPVPAQLWSLWNFDPYVLFGLAALALSYLMWGRRDGAGRMAMLGALAILFIAFVSPLCALASALFSARVFHHILLIAGAAPLLAIALPWRSGPILPLTALVIGHAVIVWTWHAPLPYGFALSSHAAYWLMQLTLLGSAYLLWREVLSPLTRTGAGLMALLATIIQMGLLGALLVFAPNPVFAPHFATTTAFGLTALQDQQLSGLLMWVPSILPYIAVALWQIADLTRPTPARFGLAR
jgi:putative membrane protein